jgi:hypothetical protein
MLKKAWAIGFGIVGVALVSGLFDWLTVKVAQILAGIDIRQFEHPGYDAFVRQELIIGAIFIAAGVLLWYLPASRVER